MLDTRLWWRGDRSGERCVSRNNLVNIKPVID